MSLIPPLWPYTLLVANSDPNLCFPSSPALLCITCYCHSEQQLQFHFLPGRRITSVLPAQTRDASLPQPITLQTSFRAANGSARKGDKLTDYTASLEATNSALPSGPSPPILTTHVTRWQSWQVREKLPFSGSQPPGLPFSTGKMVFPPVSSVKHKTCSPNQQQPQWLRTHEPLQGESRSRSNSSPQESQLLSKSSSPSLLLENITWSGTEAKAGSLEETISHLPIKT